ncbi:MAG: UDP-N-acetylmuramoyl-tripeptide--D-alanyl-D-alanine ligase [Bacteroidota bacterium]
MSKSKISPLLSLFLENGNICTDTRKIRTGDIFFALKGTNFNGNKFAAKALEYGASYVVIDEVAYLKPEDERYKLVGNALVTLQQLANAYRNYLDIPVLGITGSNGKTTTKELVASVLATEKNISATVGNLNNHIGVPLSLLAIPQDTEIAIIEMGANQPGDIAELATLAAPSMGLITNIGQAHLERLGNLEGVLHTKASLFDYIRVHGGSVFLNVADPYLAPIARDLEVTSYGTKTADFHYEIVKSEVDGMEIAVSHQAWDQPVSFQSQLSGEYNALNMLAAISIGMKLGISLESIKRGIHQYVPQNQRSQIVHYGHQTFWLDAYNANPTSMSAAIQNIQQVHGNSKVGLILGDMFELGADSEKAHKDLGRLINDIRPYVTVGIGTQMKYMLNEVQGRTFWFEDTQHAAVDIKRIMSPCDAILLKGSRTMGLERLVEPLKEEAVATV